MMVYFSVLLFNMVWQHTIFNMVWQHGIQKHKVCKVSSCSSPCLCVILDDQDNFHNMALQKTVRISKTFPALNGVPLTLPVFQVKFSLHYIRLLGLLRILFCKGLKHVPSVQDAHSVWWGNTVCGPTQR